MSPWKSLLLHAYYYGTYPYRWWANTCAAAEHRTPVVVLFYHRIADDRATSYTTSNGAFRRQMLWLKSHFDMVTLEEAQRRIRSGDNSRPCVSITFDDGYAENCDQAIPLLIKEGIPCTYFATLHNVQTGQPFAHDIARGHHFPPNTLDQLRAMADAGIDIGAHTYSHPDMAKINDEGRLHYEVIGAGEELQRRLGHPVRYFAFPFGQYVNLNARVFDLAHEVGYEGVCSAYGGYNFPGDDAFHIQRISADEEMIRLKNRTTVDPRKVHTHRFLYDGPQPTPGVSPQVTPRTVSGNGG
jgi:peptidoglycan/xylan/chitin deacetylase (PgdA/CDA1 family)